MFRGNNQVLLPGPWQMSKCSVTWGTLVVLPLQDSCSYMGSFSVWLWWIPLVDGKEMLLGLPNLGNTVLSLHTCHTLLLSHIVISHLWQFFFWYESGTVSEWFSCSPDHLGKKGKWKILQHCLILLGLSPQLFAYCLSGEEWAKNVKATFK